MYRQSTLGQALEQALSFLTQKNTLDQSHVASILASFDEAFESELALLTEQKDLDLNAALAGKLKLFRHIDGVWDLQLADFAYECGKPQKRKKNTKKEPPEPSDAIQTPLVQLTGHDIR